MVIFTADHGEVMDTRPGFFDHAGLYDDTVRIRSSSPAPGSRRSGRRGYLSAPRPRAHHPGAVRPACTGGDERQGPRRGRRQAPTAPGYEAVYLSEGTWEIKWGIRTMDWKLVKVIDAGVHQRAEDELFDLSEDPGESVNVAKYHPDVVDRLELGLSARLGGAPGRRPGPPEGEQVGERCASPGMAGQGQRRGGLAPALDRERKGTSMSPTIAEVKQELRRQWIETPSWAYGNTGTRFKVFRLGCRPGPYEKVDDAAFVHRLTGVAP